ncbi:hypothetical protein SK571_09045 [Lentzea sp. BCCO 10_0798]|uniref:Uncharacterized protein n=1 Tax=Lentzea kristufekii TaxID=3095430 RepID=A0ABU4TMK6_9PSEU|nr:hypothetical protein [Lentzea sp. BCCO 10_0798]MDX8049522.1 hypothetical protein [Lentzea sp. BCCO 10_0798]
MDALDDDLRRLFSDDRLDVQVAPEVADSVVRGADRRRRRRTAVASAFGVVAMAGVGLGLVDLRLPNPNDQAGPVLQTAAPSTSTSPPPISASTVPSAPTVTTNPPPNSSVGNPGTNTNPGSTGKKSTTPPPPATPDAQPGIYGSLALGMSEADALKTGSLVVPSSPADPENRCKAYATQSVPDSDAVVVSPVKGIVRMTLATPAKTPKKVGAGSTVEAVRTAYPNATLSGSNVIVPMAATPRWVYVFETDSATVTVVRMRLADNDCSSV